MSKSVAEVFGINYPTPITLYREEKCNNPGLIIGLELETENCARISQRDYQTMLADVWRVVEDGSLRPRGLSWEFVSHPLFMKNAIPALQDFFQKTKHDESNYTDRCSIHVHTNVTDFTQENLATLAVVYVAFEEILFKFVNHYNYKEEVGACRDTNLYCIPWSHCRMNHGLVDKLFRNPGALHRWQKYTALNLLPISEKGTVEWRHMHGTADMDKIIKWLNLIGGIMSFSKSTSFEDVVKTIKELNDTSAYQQFFTTVLGDILPYDEIYRPVMAEGVINAKYSMIDWETNKTKGLDKKAVKRDTFWADFDEPEHPEEQEDRIETDAERLEQQAWLERRAVVVEDDIRFAQQARIRVAQQAPPNVTAGAIDTRFVVNPLFGTDWPAAWNPGDPPMNNLVEPRPTDIPQPAPLRERRARAVPQPNSLR